MTENFQTYFKEVQKHYKTLDTTEFTYRTPFENFIKSLNKDCNPHQGSKTEKEIGAPDFKILKGIQKIGYIETKDLDENLDKILTTDQLKKYTIGINNLILTNYLRFIYLRKGEKIFDLSLFTLSDLSNQKYKISEGKIDEFNKMFDTFFSYKSQSIQTSEVLATELSKRAILIRGVANEQLEMDIIKARNNENYSSIFDFYQGLQELIHDISVSDAVDAYAQTIIYGLFLAKTKRKEELSREFVERCLPKNIPVIRRVFKDISGTSLPPNITWIFDEILDVLNSADIEKVMSEIDVRGKKDRDPLMHFYEDFLRLYDPEKREKRGVYYTPRPVVNYIVKSVEWILQKNFGKQLGFADDDVTVLDPATGTGTFLYLAYLRTFDELKVGGLKGLIESKIKSHVLKDFYGLEILITPYIIAHLKLSLLLEKWHYNFEENERAQVYLTNSLEPIEDHGLLPFMREINEERRVAHELVMKKPILAIIGNPPYSGMSANKGTWIINLLKNGYKRGDGSKDDGYYQVDGEPLGEKNPKWIQDDYVKFIRLAQWKIDRSGFGVIGYITNHTYLDNPTFRGMRQSLLRSFERIYILNLHGNKKKKEKCPDGSPDDNVFAIQQGTSIVFLVKNPDIKDRRIFYQDLYGIWQNKYKWLDRNTIYSTEWQELKPDSPDYLFVPVDFTLQKEYEQFLKITDIFSLNSVGIVTARDDLTIKWTKDEVWSTIIKFSKMDSEKARELFNLGEDARDWKVKFAQQDLIDCGLSKEHIVPIRYRPFDTRFTYFTGRSRGFHCMPRPELMKNLSKPNIAIVTCRQLAGGEWKHALITNTLTESCYVSNKTKEIGYIFPLYLYKNDNGREYNVNLSIIKDVSQKLKHDITAEDVFYYIYAILHSLKYRTKYLEFLKRKFPRIPSPNDYSSLLKLSNLGKELAELHLMKKQMSPTVRYEIPGSNFVDTIKHSEDKVFINKTQYFDGIPDYIWDFYIGSYQVLDRWLKYKKGRELTVQEIMQFIQIIDVLKRTAYLMNEIDKIEFLPQ
jgi:type I restriction-modification system DNA methylase subunit